MSRSLPDLLFAVRTADDTDTTVADRLESLFSIETERVANAAVLAELLAPMLTALLPLAPPAPPAVPSGAASPATLSSPAKLSRPTAARAPSIADFIDEMIAQESPPDRSSSPPRKS